MACADAAARVAGRRLHQGVSRKVHQSLLNGPYADLGRFMALCGAGGGGRAMAVALRGAGGGGTAVAVAVAVAGAKLGRAVTLGACHPMRR